MISSTYYICQNGSLAQNTSSISGIFCSASMKEKIIIESNISASPFEAQATNQMTRNVESISTETQQAISLKKHIDLN